MEATCPTCGGEFSSRFGAMGAPVDCFRERYCSEECRDRAETRENQRRATLRPWKAPEPFPWDDTDPFRE